MNDNKIIIELKPVIYAHHHGYRVVAKAHNISPAIVDALVASNHHLYFTNRKLDEQVRPLKFRFFPLTLETNEQKEKCYVLARLEPRQDVITHRGLVSATQFYVIDGDNCKIFEKELQSNAALLMAKIPFLNFNLDKLGRNEVVNLAPALVSLDADAALKQLQELPSSRILPKLRALFTREAIEVMEKRQKIFVFSKEFADPITIFNLYCRTFYTAQLEHYRQSSAFSTAELTTEIADYDLVFLHAGVGDKIPSKGTSLKLISLDNPESGKNALWYLEEEKLPEYYRLLSERIAKPSFTAIQRFKPYCDLLLNRKEYVAIAEFTDQTAGLLNFVEALNRSALGNDFFNVLARFKISARTLERLRSAGVADEVLQMLESLKDQAAQGKEDFLRSIENAISPEPTQKWRDAFLTGSIELEWVDANNQRSRTEALRDLFAVLYKVFSEPALPPDVLEPFVQLVIDWFEFLIKSRTTWAGFSTLIEDAVENLLPGAANVKEKILWRMLDEKAGLGCVPDEKEIDQPGLIFRLWLSLLDACTKENSVSIDSQMIREKIWQQQIREIIARITLADSAFSKPLRQLCHQLNDIYIEKERNKTLFHEMWRAIENKHFEETARLFFLEFYAKREFTPNDYKALFENSAPRLEAFIGRIMQALMTPPYQSLEVDYRYHESLVFKFVLNLSRLAAHPAHFEPGPFCGEIQILIRDNFIFTGKYSTLRPEQHSRFWENVEEAVAMGMGEFRKHQIFAEEIPIQAELLMNLNLTESRDYRRLRVNGYFFNLDMPQFSGRFEKLAPEAKRAFYDNLCGFVDAVQNISKLKHSILPALWSYLANAPRGNDPDVDRCFEKMMQFLKSNVYEFELNFTELCREAERIPCVGKQSKLKFVERGGGVFLSNCDHENYLLQLAVATQDRSERIKMLLASLKKMVKAPEVDHLFNEVICKYYLSAFSREKKRAWQMVFDQLFN